MAYIFCVSENPETKIKETLNPADIGLNKHINIIRLQNIPANSNSINICQTKTPYFFITKNTIEKYFQKSFIKLKNKINQMSLSQYCQTKKPIDQPRSSNYITFINADGNYTKAEPFDKHMKELYQHLEKKEIKYYIKAIYEYTETSVNAYDIF